MCCAQKKVSLSAHAHYFLATLRAAVDDTTSDDAGGEMISEVRTMLPARGLWLECRHYIGTQRHRVQQRTHKPVYFNTFEQADGSKKVLF